MNLNLSIKPAAIEPAKEPKPNRFLEETFQEFKERIFNRNHERLNFLIQHRKEMFIGYHIKKMAGLQVDLMRGGTLVMRLVNHEVSFYVNNELVAFLNLFFKKNPNEPLNSSSPEIQEIIKHYVDQGSDVNPFVD